MDALWEPLADAVMGKVLGNLVGDVDRVRDLGGLAGESYVDKDLRRLLGDRVTGRFNLRYCGGGSRKKCSDALWSALHGVADQLAATFKEPDPTHWIGSAPRTTFQPGVIPNNFRSTNRPTFQQVLEFQHPSGWDWGWGR